MCMSTGTEIMTEQAERNIKRLRQWHFKWYAEKGKFPDISKHARQRMGIENGPHQQWRKIR